MHILIIEDNEMSLVLAEYLLRQAGHQSTRATDGATGMRLALDNFADLILCDLDLPAMDGYQIVRELRGSGAWRSVPLVAFTGDSSEAAQDAVLAAGFDSYISKPIDPRTFTATIARFHPPSSSAH